MSNKQLIKLDDETASAHSRGNFLHLLIGVVMLLVGGLALQRGISSLLDNKHRLIAPSAILQVEIASNSSERALGLSGRGYLDENSGMIFVFDTASLDNCFWMKDTNFALDMVWLNEQKKVINVREHITPDTFPESFCPEEPAKYGLEVNAYSASEYGIEQGKSLRF